MPKALIYRTDEKNSSAYYRGKTLPAVHVGWDKKTGDVQIATILQGTNEPDPGVQIDGLDRAMLNELILALRKARDAVYGADA